MEKLKVGVIFGGLSSEKEVSLATGRYVYSLVDNNRFVGIPLYLAQNSKIYKLPDKLVIQNKTEDIEKRLNEAEEVRYEDLKQLVDVIFISLLGKYGEDGVIQGLLELLKIPYTGSGILTSSISMQKTVTKKILKSIGINVPNDIILNIDEYKDIENIHSQITASLNYPVIVKPSREGSSVGVSFVKDKESLKISLDEAFKWDNEIIIEEYIKGIEYMCVVLGNENPVSMIPTEVTFESEIFTYEGKYMPGKACYHTPPRNVSSDVIENLRQIALDAYKYLGIKGYGRVDGFIVGDKIYVNELHTGTIMIPSSYVFQQASRADFSISKFGKGKANIKGKNQTGLSPRTLVTTIIDLAIDSHYNKKGTL